MATIRCKKCSKPIDTIRYLAMSRNLAKGKRSVNDTRYMNCRTTIKAIYHYSVCKVVV